MIHNISIVHRGEYKILSIKYKYTKGSKSATPLLVPDDEPEIEVYKVYYKRKEIIRFLTSIGINLIYNELWKQYN